jgi:membrane dipeptidase
MPLRADASFLPQLSRYRDAGFDVVSLNVGMADVPLLEHVRVLSFMRRWIGDHADQYQLVSSVRDIEEAKASGRLGIVFDIEGMCPVQDDLSFVQTFYELGVRWMLIAYNRNNKAGGGCLDEDGGLTPVGRAIIDEMERVGMVLCLSHAGARTVSDALDYARNPPIFSHSNPYGDHAHPRNVRDDLLRRCAAKGGVVGLSGLGLFLGVNEQLVERLLRQLRYVIDLVGADHVGLGLDYVFDQQELEDFVRNNPSQFPPGLATKGALPMIAPEDLEAIANGLARANLTEAQIEGILGGNWLRVASQVWR